jgi:hypothetical protein
MTSQDETNDIQIKNDRIPNLSRILGLLVVEIFIYDKNLYFVNLFIIFYALISIGWFVLIEFFYKYYSKKPNLWFLIMGLDTTLISFMSYLSGIVFSPLQIGYIFITAQSSFDPIKTRGKFATIFSIISHSIITLFTYFTIFPYLNILSPETNSKPFNFSAALVSIGLVGIGCIAVNSIISNIYFQLKDKNEENIKILDKVKSLKNRQDIDYYLTLQLIDPLTKNEGKIKGFSIDFFLKQYKHFTFDNQDYEIGGDACFSETIYLGKEKYLFYLNADAMGKSLQGAGGVIVLSSVIHFFILQFSKPNNLIIHPAKWLYDRFKELDHVFLSFEGRMMISIHLGLIEESSSKLYFLNAEHPWTILYRDNKAQFIEKTNSSNRKLGTPKHKKNSSVIQTFQFLKGDSLFIGSDGKDDIFLSDKEMNQDENYILKTIESTGGDFSKIQNLFLNEMKSLDDISILNIKFFGD